MHPSQQRTHSTPAPDGSHERHSIAGVRATPARTATDWITLIALGDHLTQPPKPAKAIWELDLQRQIQTRQINQLGEQQRELALARRPRQPPTSRAALRKNATAKLSSDGPCAIPQHRLAFKPLAHEHNSLRPMLAIAAPSGQHRSEPAPITRRTNGRLY
jgi:hypothetical protein